MERHVEFGEPFSRSVRAALIDAAALGGVSVVDGAVYGVTQGPRLETAAEIDRLERDGCDIVGMTAMPEAVLAREAGIAYGMLATVVNAAAGRGNAIDLEEIEAAQERSRGSVYRIVEAALRSLA